MLETQEQWMRKAKKYGDIELSIQASEYHYCRPHITGMKLREYETVEIALLAVDGGKFYRPSELGIPDLDNLFENGNSPVAGYVSWADVNKIRKALRQRVINQERP